MPIQQEKLVIELQAKVDKFDKDLKTSEKKHTEAIGKLNSNLKKYDTQSTQSAESSKKLKMSLVAVGVAAGIAGAKMISFLKDSIVVAKDFEKSISQLSAITGATGKDLQFLTDAAKEFGSTTTLSASQAAEAFKLIASAKPDLLSNVSALKDVTREAITLAEAAGIDLPSAANALGNSLNQFGADADQAGKVINVLAAGAKFGSSSIADTSEALKNSGVAASAAGVSFEEANAAIQVLAGVGIKGAEAGTALRNVLTILDTDLDKNLRPSVVGVEKALDNLAKKNLDATQFVKLFGRENQTAGRVLLDNRDKMTELSKALTGTGTAYEQAATNTNNFDGDLKGLNSAIEGVQIELGEMVMEGLNMRDTTQDMTKAIQEFLAEGGGIETVRDIFFKLKDSIVDVMDVVQVYGEQWGMVFGDASDKLSELVDNSGSEIGFLVEMLTTLKDFVLDTFISIPATLNAVFQSVFQGLRGLMAGILIEMANMLEAMSDIPVVGESISELLGDNINKVREFAEEQLNASVQAIDMAWAERDARVEAGESELDALRERREAERELRDEDAEHEIESYNEVQEAKTEIDETRAEAVGEMAEDSGKVVVKSKKKEGKDIEKTEKEKVQATLGALSTTLSATESNSESLHAIRKGVDAASVLMDTPASIMRAYAELGPIGGSIAAVGLVATGITQLANINSTTSDGGGGSISTGGAIPIGGGTEEANVATVDVSDSISGSGGSSSNTGTFQSTNSDSLGEAVVDWLNDGLNTGQVELNT